jgi:iron complex outermembrane receptor protein
MRSRGSVGATIAGALVAAGLAGPAQAVVADQDLSSLSIEDLANLEVTSVSRTPQPLSRAAAAVFVITGDDIRRSGATSIPEALRLAPNLQVARLSSGAYAISARGFNHNTGTANKLQVLIDGRIVYTPLYSGVFWDEQEVPLADIDRIEVISGPGGTLWGSNAVDGVINIVTKNSRDTQGALADINGGSLDQTATVRFGGEAGTNATYRVYGMAARRGGMVTVQGMDAHDSWDKLQGGFRADWSRGQDAVTVQGDLFSDTTENLPGELQNSANSGANILARWNRSFADGTALQAQAYYSREERQTTSGIITTVDAYDVDAQSSFAVGSRQTVVTGLGYRVTGDEFLKGPTTSFLVPASRTLSVADAFVQDQISLNSDLTLTLGLKGEYNSYTGMELMPDGRIGWSITEDDLVWAAISRAVRTPARFDRDLYAPRTLAGGPDFDSEQLLAYEIGYRGQPSEALSFSLSAFYNVYDDLRTVEASSALVFPLVVRNGMEGETYGIELWGNVAAASWWRLSAGLTTLRKDLRLKPGSTDIFGVGFAGNDPSYQASIRSSMDLPYDIEFDVDMRAVDDLPDPRVPGYVEADARLAWHATPAVEFWVQGANLLHARHPEFENPAVPATEIPRSVTAGARWRF